MERTGIERRVRVIPATKQANIKDPLGNSKKRVAAYCRVSTDSAEQLNSYEAQKAYYTQKIQETQGWKLAGIFADEGITGTSLKKRKEFNRMIAACKRGKIDMIITKSLSRFARNTVDCLETIRVLKANGIGVVFEKENIDTLTESSEFLITLFSGFAQAESESLSKNVVWGRQKSCESGNVSFQYSKMLGYRKGSDGKPEIVPKEAEVVRRIYQYYLTGYSLGQIKAELEQGQVPTAQGIKGWSYQVIRNILTNEKYAGDALLQKTYVTDCISKRVKKNQGERPMYYVENHHEAIIPRDIFRRVQAEMARRSSKRKVMQKSGKTEQGKYSGKYALSELLICGECGTPYRRCTWARNGQKRIVWRCISRLEFGVAYCHHSPTLDEAKLHTAILSALNEYAANQEEICSFTMELVQDARSLCDQNGIHWAELKQRLKELTAQQQELLEQILENMDDPELNDCLKKLAVEKESILAQLKTTEQDMSGQEDQAQRMKEIRAYLEQHAHGFTAYDDALTRQVIEKITVVNAATIRIRFRDCGVELERTLR